MASNEATVLSVND